MLERLPLPLKLGLVLALAVALSTALVAISVHAVVRQRFEDYVAHEMTVRGDEIRPLLEAHFSARQNWQEVESALLTETARGHGHGMRPGMGPGTARLLLVDATGMVRYDPMRARTETTLSQAELVGAAPIIVRGQTVGYLVPQTGDQEVSFQQRLLTTIVSAGAISAVLAIALGAVLSRTALQPLTQLEKATARLGSGDLSARVSVQSQDEIGRLASRFNRMAAALEENEEHRKRLMNDIAHELRTPLTVMQGQLEALQDGIFPLNDDSLRPVYEQTLLLNRLVDDLRDLALAEAGQMALDMTMVQPEPLMRRTADRFVQAAERQQLKLDLVLGEVPV